MNQPLKETIGKGILGVIAPSAGYTISTLSAVEQWLRIFSLLGGIAVSIAMFVSIGFTIQKKCRAWQDYKQNKRRAQNETVKEETTL